MVIYRCVLQGWKNYLYSVHSATQFSALNQTMHDQKQLAIAYLLTSCEQIVGEPVQRQSRWHIEREVSCKCNRACYFSEVTEAASETVRQALSISITMAKHTFRCRPWKCQTKTPLQDQKHYGVQEGHAQGEMSLLQCTDQC